MAEELLMTTKDGLSAGLGVLSSIGQESTEAYLHGTLVFWEEDSASLSK